MNRAFIVVLGAGLAIALAQACTAHNQSDDLRCDEPTDCTDGRACIDGYCVFDDGVVDAAVDADDRCPPECTSCTGLFDDAGGYSTCVVDCTQNGSCDIEVVCPAGMECQVHCTGNGSCGSGVDCSAASACAIDCTGVGSCDGDVNCGGGPCAITCNGANSCDNDVDCSSSCRCDIVCIGNSCNSGVACPHGVCETTTPVGCSSSQDPSCNTCP